MDNDDAVMDYVRWAARYDIFYEAAPEGEMEFYLNAIHQQRGHILELGVGTGRIAIPAAAMGHRITGVDMYPTMLERARLKSNVRPLAGSIDLIEADMTKLALDKRDFDLVIIPAHTLALVTDEAQQRETLKRCAMHMAPHGTLIFNLFYPSEDLLNGDSDEVFLLGVVEDEESGLRHVLTGVNNFDTAHQTNRCVQTIETLDADGTLLEREELNVVFRYLHHEQVMEMLEQAGLRAEEVYGDFDGSSLSDESEEMIYVCRLS